MRDLKKEGYMILVLMTVMCIIASCYTIYSVNTVTEEIDSELKQSYKMMNDSFNNRILNLYEDMIFYNQYLEAYRPESRLSVWQRTGIQLMPVMAISIVTFLMGKSHGKIGFNQDGEDSE